jgi:hypothetical protein
MDGLALAVRRARALNFEVNGGREPPAKPTAPTKLPNVVQFPAHVVPFSLPSQPYDLATIVNNLLTAKYELFTAVSNRPTINGIQEMVRKRYRLTKTELIGPSRRPVYVLPRHIAMYLCCRYTFHSLPIIAKHFGDRDHTSVLHGRDRIAVLRLTDEKIGKIVNELEVGLDA